MLVAAARGLRLTWHLRPRQTSRHPVAGQGRRRMPCRVVMVTPPSTVQDASGALHTHKAAAVNNPITNGEKPSQQMFRN
jgi:hypothetical protein